MGKRQKASFVTGLSRFVLESFQTANNDSTDELQPELSASHPPSEPPTKRRKVEKSEPTPGSPLALAKKTRDSTWIEKYDASGTVPNYTSIEDVPEHLRKYYAQRERFLSLYSTPPGCLLDEEGWYSITPERVADQIAERCRCDTILDPFCGVGGNAIAFAKTCQRVIALDTSPTRLALARHNAQIYGVADRIEFILADYLQFAESYKSRFSSNGSQDSEHRKIDVVFLSPPWGGPSYLSANSRPASPVKKTLEKEQEEEHPQFPLSAIQPIHGAELFELSRQISRNIAYYLPRNIDLVEVAALLDTGDNEETQTEMVEVEEEWMGKKLKAVTCYFGGLAEGQADLF